MVLIALLPLSPRAGRAGQLGSEVFRLEGAPSHRHLRIFGKKGDFGLRNRAVTGVVRQEDGYLVDFFKSRPSRPTAPALGGELIDGIWMINTRLKLINKEVNVVAEQVLMSGSVITTRSEVELLKRKLEVTTEYRLDDQAPRLFIKSAVRLLEGSRTFSLELQDRIRWGNVDYFVGGLGRVPRHFDGETTWVGRKGAQGDLILRPLSVPKMNVEYSSTQPGLSSTITATHGTHKLDRGETLTVERVLEYGSISELVPERNEGLLLAELVDEQGRPIACKLSFKGLAGTPDPDFGNDGDSLGVSRFVWSGTGLFRRLLPVGHYGVLATAGYERDAARFEVSIDPAKPTKVKGVLPRVIQTPGVVTADLHLHQTPSVDAGVSRANRIISIAAEGVELAVATDHYTVTDLSPYVGDLMRRGELVTPLITVRGSEVSTVGYRFGHFNLFPMQAGSNVNYTDTTPPRLFSEMRKVSPQGVLQVNHPRWPGIGYFDHYLDKKTRKVKPDLKEEYASDFDAIEVFNGLDAWDERRTRRVLRDWMYLLGKGHHYTATGSSDSHKLAFADPGLPRTVIHYGSSESDAQDLFVPSARVFAALKQGHAFVTSGPYVHIDINGVEPGGTVYSDAVKLPLKVTIRAAPWIDVRSFDVLNGQRAKALRRIPVKRSRAIVRYDDVVTVPGDESFIVVLVHGLRPLPNVHAAEVKPMAFTNPIWIKPKQAQ